MKGYIYISGGGADPGRFGNLNDPLFGRPPTLGACMPNIRRAVSLGDFIFVVSGKTAGVQQYVVGGFEVAEKITALAAYDRLPANRLRIDEQGNRQGNIIILPDGSQNPQDDHAADTFESRIQNYIIGKNPVQLETPLEVARGRDETLVKLSSILDKPRANRVIDVMGRWAKLDEPQVINMVRWLEGIKADD